MKRKQMKEADAKKRLAFLVALEALQRAEEEMLRRERSRQQPRDEASHVEI